MSLMNTYGKFPVVLEHGRDVYLYDKDGKRYLDMCAGIAVNALGYHHPRFTVALKEQIEKVLHVSNYYSNQNAEEVAKKLTDHSIFDKVFFCNSGAEANEAALKLAKKYGRLKSEDKVEIIAMKQSFHGRTHGALAITGQEKYQKTFMPLMPNVHYATYNDSASVRDLISQKTCAVILEVIQGEGGIIPAQKSFLKDVEKMCQENDALLIVDEVQTGIGRTGTLFAFEHYDIKPDVVTMAKALGGGVPIGAMACTNKADVFVPGDHASTFGGNPLATCAANVVLDELFEYDLLSHVKEMGDYLRSQLEQLKEEHDCIVDIRGCGLMQGVELSVPALEIEKRCLEKGMLLIGAGEKILRFIPPLIVQKAHIDEAISILKEVL